MKKCEQSVKFIIPAIEGTIGNLLWTFERENVKMKGMCAFWIKRREKEMFCSNCGNQLGDTDLFCTKCGTPVRDREPERMIQPVYEKAEKNKKKNGWIVAILSSVAVVVLILLFVLIKISNEKVQKSFQNFRVEDGSDTDESDFDDYFGGFEEGEDYSF